MHTGRELALHSLFISLITIGICGVPTQAVRVEVDGYRAFCACIILNSLNDTTNAFPAQQLWQNLSGTIDTSDQYLCNNWAEYPDYKISVFSDRFGKPTSDILKSAGVFAPDLYAYCGPPEVGAVRTGTIHYPQFFPLHENMIANKV
jgi:hypothetical protein